MTKYRDLILLTVGDISSFMSRDLICDLTRLSFDLDLTKMSILDAVAGILGWPERVPSRRTNRGGMARGGLRKGLNEYTF